MGAYNRISEKDQDSIGLWPRRIIAQVNGVTPYCRNAESYCPVQLAESLDGLARIYVLQGKLLEAESFSARALGISEICLGPNHPDVAARLNCLIDIRVRKGKHVEAELPRKGACGL